MNRLIRALLVTSFATGMVYVLWSKLGAPTAARKARLVPPVKKVDVDSLPEAVRKELLAELAEQLQ